ncbi:MAG: 16S rRNA (cytosine(1402)-N(4))-methyltransferase RsmH [Chitinivibrionia bacterium]|nr:16S rRNA (cytosine(1402)-N(4))-methyltransferase RsmH [Chitinivibrionia bacterium]
MSDNYHIPVLLNECVEHLNIKKDGIYCDFTLGGGGHFAEIAKMLGKDGIAIGIDRDLTAVERATLKWSTISEAEPVEAKIIIEQSPFSQFAEILQKHKIEKIDGILMDLGVSSHQFDEGERGFSYRSDALLDMRMNRNDEKNAADIINFASESELAEILGEYGEVRNPQRMAKKIVVSRKLKKIETTGEFVAILNEEYGNLQNAVLSKIFQAFRIAVNSELDELKTALQTSLEYLNTGGRIVVLSYHSLEDRIVKNFLRDNAQNCVCPRELPKCVCEGKAKLELITKKSLVAKDDEISDNRRARSAKLRCGERINL